jgi:hypothetical protein
MNIYPYVLAICYYVIHYDSNGVSITDEILGTNKYNKKFKRLEENTKKIIIIKN